ncbi:MAG TPA: DUF4410 domain-containing protein [Verrucomicrobiae bacterium]|nr:DUF4410 domain-containing protein [Verrucomicrobiae bacterium]
MTSKCFVPGISLIVVAIVSTIAVQQLAAQDKVQKAMVGDAKVTVLQSYEGKDKLAKPTQILVYNLDISPDTIAIDRSHMARILDNGPIHRARGDAGEESNPDAVAEKVQNTFSKTLVKDLQKTSIPTSAVDPAGDQNAAVNTLSIHGDFTAINEGNEGARMMIGFGRGASDVQAHVVVSLATTSGPVTVSEFNLNSRSGKKPGAAATMGAGAAAGASVGAAGATDHKATVEGDASRMANAVAKQIQSVLVAQQWIAPPAAPQQSHTAQSPQ